MFFGGVKEIDAPELGRWLETESEGLRIIDVREMAEIAQGTIHSAEAIPLATLPVRLNEFEREQKLVIICRSGARSAQACQFMKQQGYDNVYNLRGGMIGWSHASLPVVRP